ncbi:peptidoglycan/xylan/chitin deacetylase (PgdA/CDA1 family) [Arthrobacter sp. PvP102]|uniref:S-layer homology domain-containing protein n=1 Tax=unclassified Arthrobacter TaxID=235627 RepID=UPI001AE7BA70|nr:MULTISPECIES: S-layer homology domain-containing protein [unclassified Arthrobacter]MBP1234740.1 peptidoglycan/xylan/chitin deacetylase (PgdA/CDA1 family) [Arthrobacter sp. PvP103]MBP1235698.1 peptidoglycan/xylan/chitin deacetylase (PgdA/CDA1 family) [Arthrobacter sp. PvP102]
MTLLQRYTAASEPRHRAERPPGRRKARWLAASTTVALAASLLGLTAPAANAVGETVVTLTFDDANVDQVVAADKLVSAGMRGTFFLPSGFMNQTNYMTTAQALALQAAGHEIGGHSVTHADLAAVGTEELARQICNDRATLMSYGLNVENFAYPFASASPAAEAEVGTCGYNSARGLGDIRSKVAGSETFPFAESLTPANLFYTGAPDQLDETWTLADIQSLVTQAQANGGGWVQLTFHHVGTGILIGSPVKDPLTVSTDTFNQFIDWLAGQRDTNTTNPVQVKTVKEVIGGTLKAAPAVVPPPAPQTTGNLVKNPSLETAGLNGSLLPRCWQAGGYGNNTRTFSTVTPGHAGTATASQQMVISAYTDGDGKLLPTLDTGECAPSATPGHTYLAKAWYKSTGGNTQFNLHYRTASGTWTYWTDSTLYLPTNNVWTQLAFTTPPVPAGATAISFGLNMIGVGTLVTDDYELYDTAGIKTFTDVPATFPLYNEISWMSNNLITNGYPDGTFKPGTTLDRGMMAAFLYRLAGRPTVPAAAQKFPDVAPTHVFYNEIQWMASTGITEGFPDGGYHPFEQVNRDQMAAFLYRMNGKPTVSATAPAFPDVTPSLKFYNEVRWLADMKITLGFPDGTFKPGASINRDQVAAFIYRYNLNFPKGM